MIYRHSLLITEITLKKKMTVAEIAEMLDIDILIVEQIAGDSKL